MLILGFFVFILCNHTLKLGNRKRVAYFLRRSRCDINGHCPIVGKISKCHYYGNTDDSAAQDLNFSVPGGTGNVSRGEGLRRGVGFAVGYKNIAYSEGFDDSAEARIRLFTGPSGIGL